MHVIHSSLPLFDVDRMLPVSTNSYATLN